MPLKHPFRDTLWVSEQTFQTFVVEGFASLGLRQGLRPLWPLNQGVVCGWRGTPDILDFHHLYPVARVGWYYSR